MDNECYGVFKVRWKLSRCFCLFHPRRRKQENHFVETFKKVLPIAMGEIIGTLYKFVEEWESEDLLIHWTTRIVLRKVMNKKCHGT